MTKQFIALADAVRPYLWMNTRAHSDFSLPKSVNIPLNALADFCASQDPNFDRERWLGYLRGECGPNGGTGKWEDDSIQFPRLLSEMAACCESMDLTVVAESMDLSLAEVNELFDRAHVAWEREKSSLCGPNGGAK